MLASASTGGYTARFPIMLTLGLILLSATPGLDAKEHHALDIAQHMMSMETPQAGETPPQLSTIPGTHAENRPHQKHKHSFTQQAKAMQHASADRLHQATEEGKRYLPKSSDGTQTFHGRHTVVLATMPQDRDVKAYGDLGSLVGGVFTRNLALALKQERVMSPLSAMTAFKAHGKDARAQDFLKQLDMKLGFNGHEAAELNHALCQQVASMCQSATRPFAGPERYLILRTDVDWTRPYTPPSRWQRVVAWFRDNLAEEAYGYVDVDAQLFERGPSGYYHPVHQWQGEAPLRTDRITGAHLSVYDDPTANTWGTRIGHTIFSAYWQDRLRDYGQIKHYNPLNRIELPNKESLRYHPSP